MMIVNTQTTNEAKKTDKSLAANRAQGSSIDNLPECQTPEEKASRHFEKQRRRPKEDDDCPDRKRQFSPSKLINNASEIDLSTALSLPECTPPQSPQDDIYRMQSPRWLDDQLEAAWDHKRSWRPTPSGPPTPSHDPSFRVPIYSPGDKKPKNMVLPEYLTQRQKALDQMKKNQSWGEAKKAHPESEHSQIENEIDLARPRDDSFKPRKSPPESGPRDKAHRTSKNFERFFKERNRSLGLEGQDYFSMSDVKKQVIMFNYGSKASKPDLAELDIKGSNQHSTRNLEISVKRSDSPSNTEELDLYKEPDMVQDLMQDRPRHSTNAPEEKRASYVEKKTADFKADSEDPFLLDNAVYRASNTKLKHEVWEEQSKGEIDHQKAMVDSQKRQTSLHALWFFPKPRLPGVETESRSSMIISSNINYNRPDKTGVRTGIKEGPIIRRTLSFPIKDSTTVKGNIGQGSSHVDDDALTKHMASTPPGQKIENAHLSHAEMSSPRQSVLFKRPSSTQSSTLPSILTGPKPASSIRNIKAFSTVPEVVFTSGDASKSSSSSSTQQRRASFAGFKTLIKMSAGSSNRSTRGLVQPFFDWKKASFDTMILDKITETDASTTVDNAFTSPAARSSGGESGLHRRETITGNAGKYMLPNFIIQLFNRNYRNTQSARLACYVRWLK